MMQKTIYFLLLFITTACTNHQLGDKSTLVEVNGRLLTKSEVLAALPSNVSTEDSTRLVNEYMESWIKQQLLLKKAELNVGNDPEIRRMVDNYKNQLLTEHYLHLLVELKAEIKPTEEQIEAFYEQYQDQYRLKEPILRGLFIVSPLDASNKKTLLKLIKDDELNQPMIEAYCLQNASKVDFFVENWVPFRTIKKHLPELNKGDERLLQSSNFYEVEDSLFNYILKVKDYKLAGDIAPLTYVHKELEEYLLNTNKINYLHKMEKNLYEEALRKGIINYTK